MAPELIVANSKKDRKYTNKVDIWSLGIFAIELAQGLPPYIDDEANRALFNIVQNRPPTISSKWSPEFKDFVQKCLQKNPAKRWSPEALMEHPFLGGAADLREEWVSEFANWRSKSTHPSLILAAEENSLLSEPEPESRTQLKIELIELHKCQIPDQSKTP